MRVSTRVLTFASAASVLALCGFVATASAQTCGDADGNGNVTVTDGVQVLRSAAGLSSTCADRASSCDVDGSGSVSVSDGVNVLRKAAGITITESCPGGDGDTADVAEVTDALVPFLALGLSEIPNVATASGSARPADTEDCEDGGSRTTDRSGVTVTVTFDACRVSEAGLGAFQFDGQIVASLGFPNSSVAFELVITDLSNQKVIDFDGTIAGQPQLGGGFVVDGGPLSVRGSNEGPEIFQVTFNDVSIDGDGHIVSGSIEAEDTSDSFELKTAEIEVEDGSNVATVHVVRDDDSEKDYQLNLETGDLTPVG